MKEYRLVSITLTFQQILKFNLTEIGTPPLK